MSCENKCGKPQVKDKKKQFVVMLSVLAGMEYKAYYINKHNGIRHGIQHKCKHKKHIKGLLNKLRLV